MIRLRTHRLVRTCAIGGNLHLAGICACLDARAKANFFYVFKIHVSERKMIKVVIKIKVDKRENYALHVCFLLPTVVGIPERPAIFE